MNQTSRAVGKIDVSFVIPAYDSQETIARTIESIASQVGNLVTETIVIDSSEHPRVKEAVSRFPGIRYIHNPVRLFPGQARNLGARLAGGEYLAFIDSDISLQENWLIRLYGSMITVKGIKAAGSVIYNANPDRAWATVLYWMEFSEFIPGSSSGFRPWLSSSNLLIKTKDFIDSPGFEMNFAMSEDMLLSRSFKGRMYLDATTSSCHRHRTEYHQVMAHLERLGYWGGRMRLAGEGRGTLLVKTRWLSLGLPFYRSAVVTRRVIRANPTQAVKALLLAPLVFLGACYWSAGFFQGLKKF